VICAPPSKNVPRIQQPVGPEGSLGVLDERQRKLGRLRRRRIHRQVRTVSGLMICLPVLGHTSD